MKDKKKIIIANEFRLEDQNGQLRALLSGTEKETFFSLRDGGEKEVVKLSVEATGLSSLTFFDSSAKERIQLSLDEKGMHIHLAGEGKQESYIFLKSNAASGFVLTDVDGNRRFQATMGPDSNPHVTIFPPGADPRDL